MLYNIYMKHKKTIKTETTDFKFISLFGDITDESSKDVIIPILKERNKNLILLINSMGGSVSAGNAIIDAMLWSKVPVYTVVIGASYSMAFNISIMGEKRFCTPLSTFMVHDSQYDFGVYNHPLDIKDVVDFQLKVDSILNKFITTKTKITPQELEKMLTSRRDNYFMADAALKKKIVDYVIKDEDELLKNIVD